MKNLSKLLVLLYLFPLIIVFVVAWVKGGAEVSLPLIIVTISCAIIYISYAFLCTILNLNRLQKILKSNGYNVKKKRVCWKSGSIIAENDITVVNISYLTRKNKRFSHHFDDINHLEIYKTTRTEFSQVGRSREGGKYAYGATQTILVDKKKIKYLNYESDKPQKTYLILNKYPNRISDNFHKEDLFNGDTICRSNVALYDISSFIKTFEK